MASSSALSDMLASLMDRRPFQKAGGRNGAITDLCRSLLSEVTEASELQLAASILDEYRQQSDDERVDFFMFLNDELDVDGQAVAELAHQYHSSTPSTELFKKLSITAEPRRQELFRRLNQAPNATAELVKLRQDLLQLLPGNPSFGRTDFDLIHLLRSWFNRGFLVLRQITWDTPASVLEKIIAYEAVHEIQNWDDLRRRLQPEDRRCFAFFHPSMPDDPLIFVEVALTKGVPGSIQDVLSDTRDELSPEHADTAVFYSISNCQAGLAGISFGNSLIKQVARDLKGELPTLGRFVTLSPIPGLSRWIQQHGFQDRALNPVDLKRLAAQYLLDAKKANGQPQDPVARFHLGNGAMIHQIHANADVSEKGMTQSGGAMVNYLYDLPKISQYVETFATDNTVVAAPSVKTLARQSARATENTT